MRVALADGSMQPLGQPGVLRTVSPSPDGRFVLVRTVHKPYSYTLPISSFPQRIDVLDLASGAVTKTVADLPLSDNVPTNFDAVPTGPRDHGWRADAPATLYYARPRTAATPR